MLDRGFSVDQVARWLGGSPATIRTVYANVLPTTGQQIGDFLDELRSRETAIVSAFGKTDWSRDLRAGGIVRLEIARD